MKPTVFLALLTLVSGSLSVAACVPEVDPQRETCGNGLDDDQNGLIDCDDPDCAGQASCPRVEGVDAGFWGACAKCGQSCSTQAACASKAFLGDERPLPQCLAGTCQALNVFLQVRIDLDTKNTWAAATAPKSGITRFIKKAALDGSAVSCSTVATAAADRSQAGALEASGRFNLQGLDVTPITNPMLGQGVQYSFVNTATGSDFLIWTEFWAGPVDSVSKLPTGKRLGYGCFEAGAEVGGPLVAQDNCPNAVNDAGVCRTFKLAMPAPEP
jgi:hypothetical protein